jgi:hypothetical protein
MIIYISVSRKKAAPVAAQQVGGASQAAMDAWAPSERASKRMAAPMDTKKVGEVSPAAVDAGQLIKKIHTKGEVVLVAAQKLGEASPAAVNARAQET